MAYTDTNLDISFDAPPQLGTTGMIRVYKLSDNSLVDSIDISTAPSATDTQTVLPRTNLEIDALALGAISGDAQRARFVWYRPVSINGNKATIRLHNNQLAFNTSYYVTVDASVFKGNFKGAAFKGFSASDGWSFTTRLAPSSNTNLRVDDTGNSADFRSLQGALNWVMSNCSSTTSTACSAASILKTIQIANGRYEELALVRNVANLTITGESREGVVVGSDNFDSLNPGTGASNTAAGTTISTSGKTNGHRILGGGRAVLLVESCDLLTLTNFTLQNTHLRSEAHDNQAEAIYFNTSLTTGAARLIAKQMNFMSQQDTLLLKGYVWIYDSLVAGNVDFIWGSVMAALFENSEIRSVRDTSSSSTTSAGYILQARAVPGDKGFVFLNSRLTAGEGVTRAYLARSGGTTSATYIDNITFINTKMGSHILPIGWCVGNGTSKSGTGTGACGSNPPPYAGGTNGAATDAAGWREYKSTDLAGALLDVSGRLASQNVTANGATTSLVLAKQMDSAAGYSTRAEVFSKSTIANGSAGSWVPTP